MAIWPISERIATSAGLKQGDTVGGLTVKFIKPLKRRIFNTGKPATPNRMRILARTIKCQA